MNPWSVLAIAIVTLIVVLWAVAEIDRLIARRRFRNRELELAMRYREAERSRDRRLW